MYITFDSVIFHPDSNTIANPCQQLLFKFNEIILPVIVLYLSHIQNDSWYEDGVYIELFMGNESIFRSEAWGSSIPFVYGVKFRGMPDSKFHSNEYFPKEG